MRTTTTAVVLALMAGVVGLAWLVVSVTLLHAGNPTLPADGGASVGGSAFLRRHEPPAATSGDRAAFSVTLVTQSSSERLWLLRETCQRWTGPLVLVVFVPPSAADPHPDPEAHLWVPMADGSKAKIGEGVCPDAHVITHRPSGSAVGPYPVNRLRNLAVAAVRTTHFFLLDIDFWPAADLEQRLVAYATGGAGSGSDAGGDGGNTDAGPYSGLFALDRSAIVVPAFNFLGVSQGCPFADNCRQTYQRLAPRTFPQLLDCLDERGCQIFDVSRNPGGHSSTNTPHWLQMGAGPDADGGSGGPRPSPLSYRIPCFQSMKYEPYVVLKRSAALPQFDERFSGYGKNKIEFVHHLRLLNFSFTVLPGLFAVHLPHAKSQAFSHWLEADRQRVDALFDNFIAELSARHAGQYDTPMCDGGDQDESNRLTE